MVANGLRFAASISILSMASYICLIISSFTFSSGAMARIFSSMVFSVWVVMLSRLANILPHSLVSLKASHFCAAI